MYYISFSFCLEIVLKLSLWQSNVYLSASDSWSLGAKWKSLCHFCGTNSNREREFIDTFKSFLTSQNDPCRCLFCFWHRSHCAKCNFNVWHTQYDTVLNVHWVPMCIGFMCACYLTEKFEQIFRGFLEFTKSLLRIRLKIAVNAFLMAYYCPA